MKWYFFRPYFFRRELTKNEGKKEYRKNKAVFKNNLFFIADEILETSLSKEHINLVSPIFTVPKIM
jgi:hypothetical protein